MNKNILLTACLLCCFIAKAQQSDSLVFKNGIDNPNHLTTHHFGMFSSRISTNFKFKAPKRTTFNFNISNGNTFHPFVEAYLPKDQDTRDRLSQLIWHDRTFNYIDQEITPADYMNIVVDAVIKEFRANLSIPLSKNQELSISLRSNLITKGKYPFSLFTSDESIEWFHSNIAGGEDPYGRRYYGLNQVDFKYTDRNGKVLEFDNNDFFIGGLELNHYYYPEFLINKNRNIFINFGSHLGLNTSKYNSSIDFGISANAVKKIDLKNNYELNIALGANLLRKNLIDFQDNVDLGNNHYLGTAESTVEITKYTKKRNYNAFSINYQLQSRYNKKEEASYYRLVGKWREINGGWQYGISTLYRTLANWNFTYTYGRPNLQLAFYAKEDFIVNNAPDFQTGFNIKIPVFN
ncbi:hypothetical protein [Algibacter sp. L4_22]|uniref:hypothetical protein n=1 Tax=Algibacter sp. L4_22 TaxID=2942477 RepID=UPI00201B8F0E|nr:hypothetical protein [Algibacter sp. L4_22]MCL5130115.1 hypothetical protein [Algibacter sp. L4_22]